VEISGSVSAPYLGRAHSIRRCLANLVENATKYGNRAWVSVSDHPDGLEIVVRDAGRGIPESELERVFEPFYRLERSRNRETGGTGLGLSIARAIARAHGGDVVLRLSRELRDADGGCAALTPEGQCRPYAGSNAT
jgi:signal transduction histidine kinase